MRIKIAVLLLVLCLMPGAHAQQGSEDAGVRVQKLVRDFLAAEQAFDPKRLATLIDPDYFEISPAGEFDEHDRFLDFYTPDKRVEYPPSTLSEEHLQLFDQ